MTLSLERTSQLSTRGHTRDLLGDIVPVDLIRCTPTQGICLRLGPCCNVGVVKVAHAGAFCGRDERFTSVGQAGFAADTSRLSTRW